MLSAVSLLSHLESLQLVALLEAGNLILEDEDVLAGLLLGVAGGLYLVDEALQLLALELKFFENVLLLYFELVDEFVVLADEVLQFVLELLVLALEVLYLLVFNPTHLVLVSQNVPLDVLPQPAVFQI